MTPTVRVYRDVEAMTRAASALVRRAVDGAVGRRGRASLALSGGSTPRPLYERLGGSIDASTPPWSAVDFFWSDERSVPADSPDSNYRLAADTLLRPAGIRADRIHPAVLPRSTPEASATSYERTLREYFGTSDTTFDLTLLGVGEDGHTASLFPGSAALAASSRWVEAIPRAPRPPHVPRITLTLRALNGSRIVVLLASGDAKARAVARCLRGSSPRSTMLPAQRVAGQEQTLWLLDAAAAARLPAPPRGAGRGPRQEK